MDKKKYEARPLVGVISFIYLQCFDTVGWVTAWQEGHPAHKKPAPKSSLPEHAQEENWGGIGWGSAGKMAVKMEVASWYFMAMSCLFMAALRSRCRHYIFALWFLLLSIFLFFLAWFQPSQIGCLPYFHTWCGLCANLRCSSETCCSRLAENTWCKKSPKIAIWAPSHYFVGPYVRN